MTKLKKAILFTTCSMIIIIILGYFVRLCFKQSSQNPAFNIVFSENNNNRFYLKTRDEITKSGKDIVIDNDGSIFSHDYIE